MTCSLTFRITLAFALGALSFGSSLLAQNRNALPGMFKELDDEILGNALVTYGKRLFIDDYVIGELRGLKKQLNRPVKHLRNPILMREGPSDGLQIDYGSVIFDPRSKKFQLWYQVILGKNFKEHQTHQYLVGYAISDDGIIWTKPIVDEATKSNLIVFDPPEPFVGGPGVMIDDRDPDPARRYKMVYAARPDGKSSSLATHVAYSTDGVHWKQEARNPVVPYSDTQISPYWDEKLSRYVAYLRFGPPNVRHVSRIESANFAPWSPKVTVLKKTELDVPYATEFYGMVASPYSGVYLGLLNPYHGETIKPIPADRPWMDRVNNQLVFSHNGVTCQRVIASGVITSSEHRRDRDWQSMVDAAVFLPYGTAEGDWDWGQVYPHHAPLVVGDEIRFSYGGTRGRHWATYHHDPIESGVGLATLRLDGFVSVEAGVEPGTLTTKPLVFLGDTLEVNANATGGALTIEALDATGKAIDGFTQADSLITMDSGSSSAGKAARTAIDCKAVPSCYALT